MDTNLEQEREEAQAAAAQLADDPFGALEQQVTDEKETRERNVRIRELYEQTTKQWGDVYGTSTKVRKVFREQRKAAEKTREQDNLLREKLSLDIPLAAPTDQDAVLSASVSYARGRERRRPVEALVRDAADAFSPSFNDDKPTRKPAVVLSRNRPLVDYSSDSD